MPQLTPFITLSIQFLQQYTRVSYQGHRETHLQGQRVQLRKIDRECTRKRYKQTGTVPA